MLSTRITSTLHNHNLHRRYLRHYNHSHQRFHPRCYSSTKNINQQKVRLSELPTPSFVINRHSFVQNCQQVLDSAKSRNLKIRPHVKTHKSSEGSWIQAFGRNVKEKKTVTCMDNQSNVTGFVASTLPEIKMLLDETLVSASDRQHHPFGDIIYGVPISTSKLPAIVQLQQQFEQAGGTPSNPNPRIHVIVDHVEQLLAIERFSLRNHDNLDGNTNKSAEQTTVPKPFTVFLKLDTGYHRAGVPATSTEAIDLAMRIHTSKFANLVGVYSHCGHAYDANEHDTLQDIAKTDLEQIQQFLNSFRSALANAKSLLSSPQSIVDDLIVSVGSTPSLFHHPNNKSDVDIQNLEIHPGNYTLYDRQQLWTGACRDESQVAGRVMARVIGHYEDRDTILIDAGATALTKETTPQGGMCSIGGYPHLVCLKMSQEVTIVKLDSAVSKDTTTRFPFEDFPIGSLVNLLPNHSCLSAACFDKYYIIDDPTCTFSPDQEVVDEWIPTKGFALNETNDT